MEALPQTAEHIWRLQMPYEDIDTSVFFIQTPKGTVMFDTGSSDTDVESRILPAMKELGIPVVTHSKKLKVNFPGQCFLSPADGSPIMEMLWLISIPGHTGDSMGLLDTRSGILLTGDCLQVYGIYGSGAWGACIGWPTEHLAAIRTAAANGTW